MQCSAMVDWSGVRLALALRFFFSSLLNVKLYYMSCVCREFMSVAKVKRKSNA